MVERAGLTKEHLAMITSVLATFPAIEQAVLFGSRARKTHKHASDVDIAIKGAGVTTGVACSVKSAIEENTTLPYFVDVVAYDEIENDVLKDEIDATGLTVYEVRQNFRTGVQ